MLVKLRLAGALVALVPAVAGALGLGEAHVLSALNQPLNASIDMLVANADDLKDLSVTLAPRDVFERQGLERPAYLNSLVFKVSRNAMGEPQVEVHSAQPATEPFLTFLVAIDWPRGHLVREYTLLLDPPVFEAKRSAPEAVVAPATGVSTGPAGSIDRTGAAAAAAADRPSGAEHAVEHQVMAGETLSSVVRSQGYSAAADVNRALIATFRANPDAFDGNINRLRRGAILRVPPKSTWAQLGVDEATAEVHRQVGSWKGDHHEAHLRLVVPKTLPKTRESAPETGSAGGAESSDVAKMRLLIELKNTELARLQAELAKKTPAPATAPATAPNPTEAPVAVAPPPPASTPAAEPKAAVPVASVPPRKMTATPPLPAAEPGILDVLLDNATTLVAGLLGVLVLVLVGLKLRARREQSHSSEVASAPATEFGSRFTLDGDPNVTHPLLSATPRAEADKRHHIDVTESDDESGEFQPPAFNSLTTQAIPHSATPGSPPLDSRLGAESSITLHHMDPLAEADFHIAYGLYAQAADILRLAIELEPGRSDLKLKLLEVHFVAGDSAAFLGAANALDRHAIGAADWDRVAVMGRQIAPDDALFKGTIGTPSGIDFDLGADAATAGLDLEIAGGDTVAPVEPQGSGWPSDFHLDLEKDLLDLSATLDPSTAHTLPPSLAPATATVPTSAGDSTAELELEDLGFPDTLLDALPAEPEHVNDFASAPEADESTRLMPDLSADDGYTRRMPQLAETPAVESGGESAEALLEEATRLLANLWPETSPPLDASQSATLAMPELDSIGASSSVDEIVLGDPLDDSNFPTATVPVLPPSASQPTDHGASLAGLRLDELNLGDEPLEFDLDDLARALQDDTVAQPLDRSKFNTEMLATGLHVRPTQSPQPVMEDDVSRSRTNDLDLPELDPVTLSEVGTKLDLARAYLDMGDPDGARAILDEVLSEGSPSQKSEAQRLLETLPG